MTTFEASSHRRSKTRTLCKVKNCTNTIASRGMCSNHRAKWCRKHIAGFLLRERRTRNAWRTKHHKRLCQWARRWAQKTKDKCYAAYGGYVCRCCGEKHPAFLTLDHVNGNGAAHRRKVGSGGSKLYRWIIRHKFPKQMFRVLCWNCNVGRQLNGGICPHKRRKP